ncbi:MAG: radical SAM protein [Pseudomonadales bacterium]|nr:radical SAM protein [Pseudomonadales bacterium]
MFGIPPYGLNLLRPHAVVNRYRALLSLRSPQASASPAHGVVEAYIEPTVQCDLDCVFCQSKTLRRHRRGKLHMTYDEFTHVLDAMPTLAAITLTGMGEPTLNSDLFRMIGLARSRGIAVRLVTNCNRHTPDITRNLLSAGLWWIGTSIDGALDATHERGRRGGNRPRAMENLQRLLDQRVGRRAPIVNVEMLAFDYNYHEIPDLAQELAAMGVDELDIRGRLTDWGKQQWKPATIDRRAGNDAPGFHLAVERARELTKASNLEILLSGEPYSAKRRCPKPWGFGVYVATTGDVVPCCTIADPGVVTMGNIFRQPWDTIWNSHAYRELRASLLDGAIPSYCRNCYGEEKSATQASEAVRWVSTP